MPKQKFYVVWKGRSSGVFNSWDACSAQVTGFDGAEFKSFASLADAKKAFQRAYSDFVRVPVLSAAPRKNVLTKALSHNSKTAPREKILTKPVIPSISVDAACSGVPGPVEWRGVETETGKELFKIGPFPSGTNNVGEFLAIVHGLGWLKNNQLDWPLYSDSKNAILWVKIIKCRTKLIRTTRNNTLFELITRAETWLNENRFSNKILKWETTKWGENPADFGRK